MFDFNTFFKIHNWHEVHLYVLQTYPYSDINKWKICDMPRKIAFSVHVDSVKFRIFSEFYDISLYDYIIHGI
jgi:hypothetical protein